MSVLYVGLLWASITDWMDRKISNRVVLFLMVWGIARCVVQDGFLGCFLYGIRGLAVFLVFYPFYKIGALGAGDVKLITVAAGYFPGNRVLGFLCYSFLAAALAAMVKMWREGNGRERMGYLADYIWSVIRTGRLQVYEQELKEKRQITICLAGPLLVGALLQGGGIF